MSKTICSAAIQGARAWLEKAEADLARAIEAKGGDHGTGFPDTAYSLPIISSMTGKKCETLNDLKDIMERARDLIPQPIEESCWTPYLGPTLDAGMGTLFACEVVEACKYAIGPEPEQGIWRGAASDVIMRERGVEFVDGTAPGFAAITGAAPTNEDAVRIARELQEKGLYVFMAGPSGGVHFAEQLEAEGVQLGWETRLIPFGPDVSSLVYGLGFANRVAMAFGGLKPGQARENLLYNKDRVFAFVLALGEITPDKCALAAGAFNYGFPVIADSDVPEIRPSGICTYEHLVSNVDLDTIVDRALEVRGCKITIHKVPIPVPYGPAFEGEVIRKGDVHAEFGGPKSTAFEFLTSAGMDDIEDHAIEVIGPDVDEVEPGTVLPLAIWVEVAGRKMQPDFEPILERQIHHLLNGAEGVWHMGQRDIVWTRISKQAYERGFKLKDYGEILHAKLLSEYPSIVDKVQVTLITDKEEVDRRIETARKIYDERNRRLESMTDEAVDTFYSCLLCQSFAPNHVCVITPERSGLCGAYNWLDGKAAHEIDNTGPNQPVSKGNCLDPEKGIWKGVNDYVYSTSNKAIEKVSAYSVMDSPMTSCGCFEAIAAYVPECNGVMIVHRDYGGMTPVGMKFSTLAGNVGGGVQTPGFIGMSKIYSTSKKFLRAEGGHKRLIWMPRELKEQLGPDLKKRFEEAGVPDLLDKIPDETVGTEAKEIREYLETQDHPAIHMEDMEAAVMNAPEEPEEQVSREETGEDLSFSNTGTDISTDSKSNGAPAVPDMEQFKQDILREVRESVTREVVGDIIGTLQEKFLGRKEQSETKDRPAKEEKRTAPEAETASSKDESFESESKKIPVSSLQKVPVIQEPSDLPVNTVLLGKNGDSGRRVEVGGATAMPFHFFEGTMPNRPKVALEVFDTVGSKYPPVLAEKYKEVIHSPADHAAYCVKELGADMISVRLTSTHPERGGKSPSKAVETVGKVLESVDVPLIISGHSHFDTHNEMMKAVAKEFEGENLLLNWVEQDNYRTIAGAALAYGHKIVAQSPIDVNIAKQLNILLQGMDLGMDRIVIDPTTGGLGYGLEYTYSVMERIRLTALGGDKALASPMLVSPGPECAKIKEMKAPEEDFPAWGDLEKRAKIWELGTAVSLLYSGADILIMYHPDAAVELQQTINGLMAE